MNGIGYYPNKEYRKNRSNLLLIYNMNAIHQYHRYFYDLLSKQPGHLSPEEKLWRIDSLSCREALEDSHTMLNPDFNWFFSLGAILLYLYHHAYTDKITGDIKELYVKVLNICAYQQRGDVKSTVRTPEENRDLIKYYVDLRQELKRKLYESISD